MATKINNGIQGKWIGRSSLCEKWSVNPHFSIRAFAEYFFLHGSCLTTVTSLSFYLAAALLTAKLFAIKGRISVLKLNIKTGLIRIS